MADVFKKLFYTGVGLVSLTSEKVQETVDELVKQRKISQEEGKKIVDDFIKETEAKKEDFEDKLKKVVEEVVDKFEFLTGKDLDELRNRIDTLESKVTKKPATRTRKKTTNKAKV